MNIKMKKWVGAALAVAVCVGGMVLLAPVYTDQRAEAGNRAGVHRVPAAEGKGSLHAKGGGIAQVQPASANAWFDVALSANTPAMVSPLSTMSPPLFAANSRGKLILNADTHANMEKLLLEEHPKTMGANLDQASRNLPPQARAELKVLVGQFQQYTKALPHTIPPDNAPETEQEHLKLLDSLHALRVSYLGAEATQAMFGEEEATTRQLIGLMAAQNDPSLSTQQKADRAQETLNRMRQPKPPPAG